MATRAHEDCSKAARECGGTHCELIFFRTDSRTRRGTVQVYAEPMYITKFWAKF